MKTTSFPKRPFSKQVWHDPEVEFRFNKELEAAQKKMFPNGPPTPSGIYCPRPECKGQALLSADEQKFHCMNCHCGGVKLGDEYIVTELFTPSYMHSTPLDTQVDTRGLPMKLRRMGPKRARRYAKKIGVDPTDFTTLILKHNLGLADEDPT